MAGLLVKRLPRTVSRRFDRGVTGQLRPPQLLSFWTTALVNELIVLLQMKTSLTSFCRKKARGLAATEVVLGAGTPDRLSSAPRSFGCIRAIVSGRRRTWPRVDPDRSPVEGFHGARLTSQAQPYEDGGESAGPPLTAGPNLVRE